MNCAFHSRTHKHADDLSFVWYERGRRLLIDPGRYGYIGRVDPDSGLGRQGFWYSDPKRIYLESTRAHNALEIDGRSYARKGVRPYGSALKRAGEQNGIAFAEGHVRHRKSLLHSRLLLHVPGRWLVVLDSIADSAGAEHKFVQRFHFSPDLPVEALGDQLAITVPREAQRLYIAPLLSGATPARSSTRAGKAGAAGLGITGVPDSGPMLDRRLLRPRSRAPRVRDAAHIWRYSNRRSKPRPTGPMSPGGGYRFSGRLRTKRNGSRSTAPTCLS